MTGGWPGFIATLWQLHRNRERPERIFFLERDALAHSLAHPVLPAGAGGENDPLAAFSRSARRCVCVHLGEAQLQVHVAPVTPGRNAAASAPANTIHIK